ncbi:protein encore-like isoform X5 [Anopheles darlingi]|nr:protein encore-like isoform X5 [Anopheles darlingi]
MRESTSPPRTPTPRSPTDQLSGSSSSNSNSPGGGATTTNIDHSTAAIASDGDGTPLINGTAACQLERSPVDGSSDSTVPSGEPRHGKHVPNGNSSPNGKSQLDVDFPKLTPPKTSFNPNATSNGSNGSSLHVPSKAAKNGGGQSNSAGSTAANVSSKTNANRAVGEGGKVGCDSASSTTNSNVCGAETNGRLTQREPLLVATGSSSQDSGSSSSFDQPDGVEPHLGGSNRRGMATQCQSVLAVSVGAATEEQQQQHRSNRDDEESRNHGTPMSSVLTSSAPSANSNYCDNEGRQNQQQQHHHNNHHQHRHHQQQSAQQPREVYFAGNQHDDSEADATSQINIQFSHETETRYIQCDSPTESLMRSSGGSSGAINLLGAGAGNNATGTPSTPAANTASGNNGGSGSGGKKRSGASGKGGGSKAARLKNMSGGSSSSVDGGPAGAGPPTVSAGSGGGAGPGNASGSGGFAGSRDSCEQFTDQSGVNLLQFFKETLNKNFKDRNMLMKIEKELLALAMDRSRSQMKFPPMSSYNRMLIHRVAAYFGMEHNVDATQQCVIAEVTSGTRIPEIRFKNLISDSFSEEPRKSILKRDTHSFDEYHRFGGGGAGGVGSGGSGSGLLHCPDRGMLDRKAKSFEEREEEYDKTKRRLFKNRGEHDSEPDQWQWISTDVGGGDMGPMLTDMNVGPRHQQKLQNNRLLKVQSVSIEGRSDERPCVSKSHSFGGYGGSSQNASLLRGDSITSTKSAGARLFTKQDSNASANTPWRLSPSSSGSYLTSSYKTQSIRSDSVTPSPTGYGSGDHTPEPCGTSPSSTCGVMWAVTDMASVPKGSVLIDPQTFQPIVNQDGTLYHFDPSNLPPAAGGPWPGNGKVSKRKFEKQKSFSSKHNPQSSSSLESPIEASFAGRTVDCGQQTQAMTPLGDNPITTITTTTPTTITEEVVNELGCYDGTGGTGGLPLLDTTKDNADLDESSSICDEISQTTNELGAMKLQKHQATSPMLLASELQPVDMNEIQYGTNQSDHHGNLVSTALSSTPVLVDDVLVHRNDVEPSAVGGSAEVASCIALSTTASETECGDKLTLVSDLEPVESSVASAVQLLQVHEPVSSSTTLDAGEDVDEDDEGDDRSETPTDAGQEEVEEVDKKNDMVKVANVVQTVVPLASYTSSATPTGGVGGAPGASVGAYTVTYDGGGGGHPGTTVYGTPALSTTTYQTGPDGSIYAVPSSLVYTYPTTMDPSEMSGGYFVPVFDPQQRDAASLCSTPGASIYTASAGAPSTVLHPIAYTPTAAAAAAAAAAYGGTPLYQNPLVYSSDQFPTAQAAAAAQLSQYPISYPIGIGYPFNGATYQNYWNQPITYYVPQAPVQSATVGGPSLIMPSPIAQTPTNGAGSAGIITTTNAASATHGTVAGTSTAGPGMGGKRNGTPPNNHVGQGHAPSQPLPAPPSNHSASVTPVPISPYATNIPVPLPDPSSAAGAPMYAAFPQPLYPNMLPFASPLAAHPHSTAAATAAVNSMLPTAAPFHHHAAPQSSASGHHHHHHHHQQQQQQHQQPQHQPSHPHHNPIHSHSHPHGAGGSSAGGGAGSEATVGQGQHYGHAIGPNTAGASGGGGSNSSSSSASSSSHGSNNGTANAQTPQSTPSTPLSLPMSLPAHHGGGKGGSVPLFPTPPMVQHGPGAGGYSVTATSVHHHYGGQIVEERKNGGPGGYQGSSKGRLPNAPSSGGSYFNYSTAAGTGVRQMTPNGPVTGPAGTSTYQPNNKGGGSYATNTGNNTAGPTTGATGGPLILGPPPPGKGGNRHESGGAPTNSKPPLIPTLPTMVANTVPPSATGGAMSDKSRLNRSSKPPNLDLKRGFTTSNSYHHVVNSRNTPSTNSNESNGSPNSITSSSVHEHGHPTGGPIPPPAAHPNAVAHHHPHPHHHHQGAHGGSSNHSSTPTTHGGHHGGHAVVPSGPHQNHHHPQHPQHHHGSVNTSQQQQQQQPPQQQLQHHHHHGSAVGGGGGAAAGAAATHYYTAGPPGSGQPLAAAGPHGQASYYTPGGTHTQRGGSVGSNNGNAGSSSTVGGTNGGTSGTNNGGHATHHTHALTATAATVMHNTAVAAAAAAVEPYHQQLIPINATPGMSYVKIGHSYFPSLALPQSRRSPPNEIRPLAGVYPTMNMVMPASARQFTPRPQHSSGYGGNKATKTLR